ncbi:NAD(P)/FAD-dependent oxidoreductase [Croceivirga thetidis]|uniref:NAD(P)/FAD-dependent oxidoreductase n=1 Tax=Croceivirga thetidis TaxID=2721623 RepID=A0ABX1GNZ0_9FLAO|nr:NAD(P)/FAD-dependent oxidoreductase [Croceivirga thetidis]NKI31633.1 NAD(P)/FAD-dependent oxidoreductase [Croceivirga thetidis]
MFDVIIVGGGAAGFYAAIHIAQQTPNADIAIFERGKTVLGKVKVSGGGRCNVTHAEFDPKELSTNYPRGEKELLGPFYQYAPGDVVSFFEERGVALKIEEDGRIFPKSNSSQTIIDCLINETDRLGIQVLKNSAVKTFCFIEDEECWRITTQNKHYKTKKLLLATGSNPKVWNLLETLGHNIVEPTPSLFTFNIKDYRLENNQGLSSNGVVEVIPRLNERSNSRRGQSLLRAEGPILITHWGLSGPAILKLSAWGSKTLASYGYRFSITINWLPDHTYASFLELLMNVKGNEPKKTVFRTKVTNLPSRLWVSLAKSAEIDSSLKWADISKSKMQNLAHQLTKGKYAVNGKSTFKEEFVTAGGIDLKEIDFKTFQSKKFSGLYFAGEIVNVDAITGGFNFQNAWTGAFLAAKSISEELTQPQH